MNKLLDKDVRLRHVSAMIRIPAENEATLVFFIGLGHGFYLMDYVAFGSNGL